MRGLERNERKDFECNMEEEKGIQDAKESERDMERILEDAMEQVKILNLDFGKEFADRKTMVKEAASLFWKKVTDNDKEEFGKILKGARIDILGKSVHEGGWERQDTYGASADHVWVQECKRKFGGDRKEARLSGILSMAEGMHGIRGQGSREGGDDGIWQGRVLYKSKTCSGSWESFSESGH
jgi:hypothetical protein